MEITARPNVVSPQDWLAARKDLLAAEKDLTRMRDAVNARRRRLPMVRLEKDYVFEGPEGKRSLADLFEGRSQLYVHPTRRSRKISTGCGATSSTPAAELLPRG